jgi:hypothetical protein
MASPPKHNVRAMREVLPGEHAGFVRLIGAIAKLQNKPAPTPEPKRARA